MRPTLRGLVTATALAVCALAANAQTSPDEGWPAGERVMTKYKAGNYAEVIAQAPDALRGEPWNHELRLAYANSLTWSNREWPAAEQYRMLLDTEVGVDARLGLANALAWSGRMKESLPHYRLLFATKHAGEAKQGYANALRWMGRDDLAIPIYEELRATYPDQEIGKEGLFYSRRAVRPRTTLGIAYNHDNTEMNRSEPILSQSWRMADNSILFGIEASDGHDWFAIPAGSGGYPRREYGLRFEALAIPLEPRLFVSRQEQPDETVAPFARAELPGRTFGEVRLTLADWPLYVHAGRVNWGKLGFTPGAQLAGLEADRYGFEVKYQTEWGEVRAFANHFRIFQGSGPEALKYDADNTVNNGDLRLVTRWRPWTREIKPFFGVHLRYSDHTDPLYWSPKKYALGYLGLEGEWESRDWNLSTAVQGGFKLAGEANTAWLVSVGGKRWLNEDWAVGFNAFAQSGTRTTNYRAQGAGVTIEKLW